MRVTKLEEVTRTYCDICKNDITREGCYGYYDNYGKPVDICTGNYSLGLSCEQTFLKKRGYIAGDIDFN